MYIDGCDIRVLLPPKTAAKSGQSKYIITGARFTIDCFYFQRSLDLLLGFVTLRMEDQKISLRRKENFFNFNGTYKLRFLVLRIFFFIIYRIFSEKIVFQYSNKL